MADAVAIMERREAAAGKAAGTKRLVAAVFADTAPTRRNRRAKAA